MSLPFRRDVRAKSARFIVGVKNRKSTLLQNGGVIANQLQTSCGTCLTYAPELQAVTFLSVKLPSQELRRKTIGKAANAPTHSSFQSVRQINRLKLESGLKSPDHTNRTRGVIE
jgi:hypothetical protein